jgi:hypothetical protein
MHIISACAVPKPPAAADRSTTLKTRRLQKRWTARPCQPRILAVNNSDYDDFLNAADSLQSPWNGSGVLSGHDFLP